MDAMQQRAESREQGAGSKLPQGSRMPSSVPPQCPQSGPSVPRMRLAAGQAGVDARNLQFDYRNENCCTCQRVRLQVRVQAVPATLSLSFPLPSPAPLLFQGTSRRLVVACA